MRICNAQVFSQEGAFQKRDLFLQNGSFAEPCEGEIFDAEGLYAIPGLIDLHFHGCAGYDFCDATAQSLDAISGV